MKNILIGFALLVAVVNALPFNNDVKVSDYVDVNSRYKRAAFQEDDRKNRTVLCDELKLKTVVDEHSTCYRRAERGIVNKIAADDTQALMIQNFFTQTDRVLIWWLNFDPIGQWVLSIEIVVST